MNKVTHIFKSFFGLMKEHKLYVLMPMLMIFSLLAFLVYYIGPAAIVSLFYAGL